ncbi:MAG: 16S rRNA (uracil(1498)-N(3))-methyltransferase [Candidatus Omnitrophica bacterium]|nr:16S rRNA (uracil(1498)-N(3))-methyltransferase [Candidatus Omnitrophota bacterium]
MPRGLRRFYVDRAFSAEGAILNLSPRETFHLHRVLRLKRGDKCRIFNRQGRGAEATIDSISETEGAKLKLAKIFSLEQKSLFLKVGQVLPQKRKMDDLVEKSEELGIQELWALESERSVVKMSVDAKLKVRQRWERIVIEAAKQSGNPILTEVKGPASFNKVIEEELNPAEPVFIFHTDPRGITFSNMIEECRNLQAAKETPSIFLFFGPEGGFTEKEVRLAESRGAKRVFLEGSTLRLETAFIGVVSAIRFLMF